MTPTPPTPAKRPTFTPLAPTTRRAATLMATLALALGVALPLPAADDDDQALAVLANDPANDVWEVAGRRQDELHFEQTPGAEPVLVFNTAAFRERELTFQIETDSRLFIITNGLQTIELRLEHDDKYRITFDGDKNKPRLLLNNKPLLTQSPTWGRIVNDENRREFRLMLRSAREAELRITERGRTVKLKENAGDGEKEKE